MEKQIRGRCQACAKLQALTKGRMALHGYTVDHGYFNGTCAGAGNPPLQTHRDFADEVLIDILKDCDRLEDAALRMEQGESDPAFARVRDGYRNGRSNYKLVHYAELSDPQKVATRREAVSDNRNRARMGRAHVESMRPLIEMFHGTALVEVVKPEPAKRISAGEKKVGYTEGAVYTARYQDKARVYYRSNSGRDGWLGTQAWRKLEDAPQPEEVK